MTMTESFGRGRIVDAVTASQTVPFTLKVSRVPNNENQFITLDPDTDKEEIFFYTTKTGTVGSSGTLNITARGYNPFNNSTDVGNQQDHDQNIEFKLALNHIIINDKLDKSIDNVLTADIQFTGTDTIGLNGLNNLTTAQRDALSPNNGAFIYNTDTNTIQQFVGGGWSDVGDTGTPDASETVAGKVEIATTAEADAGTDVGGTGAPLVIIPSQLVAATPSADETTEGLVERATDAEVVTGTDTTRYTTPKQGTDNYVLKTQNQIIARNEDAATETIVYPHTLGAVPKLITFHSILATNQFGLGSFDGTTNSVVYALGTPGAASNLTYSIRANTSSSNNVGAVTAVTANDFSILWTRTGSPTSATTIIHTTLIA